MDDRDIVTAAIAEAARTGRPVQVKRADGTVRVVISIPGAELPCPCCTGVETPRSQTMPSAPSSTQKAAPVTNRLTDAQLTNIEDILADGAVGVEGLWRPDVLAMLTEIREHRAAPSIGIAESRGRIADLECVSPAIRASLAHIADEGLNGAAAPASHLSASDRDALRQLWRYVGNDERAVPLMAIIQHLISGGRWR